MPDFEPIPFRESEGSLAGQSAQVSSANQIPHCAELRPSQGEEASQKVRCQKIRLLGQSGTQNTEGLRVPPGLVVMLAPSQFWDWDPRESSYRLHSVS